MIKGSAERANRNVHDQPESIRPQRAIVERFCDFHFTDRITYRQSVNLIRILEFRASSAQLYVSVS